MTLQEALTAIKSAIYGEDVRSAIIEGLQLCYTERTSGGYAFVEDANDLQNGITLCTSSTEHRPYDAPFLLYSAGSDAVCCQVAIDPDGTRSNSIRKKENNVWSEWTNIAEDTMYYIRYWSQNGSTLLYTERVSEGHSGYWNGKPTKPSSDQYDYIFAGWSTYPNQTSSTEGVITNVRSNKDVYAAFSSTLRSYTVTFYNGVTQISSQTIPYGGDASALSTDPTKEATEQYTYRFIGWSIDPNASEADADALTYITGDRTLYAVYDAILRSYNVTFKNGSNTLQTVSVEYDGTAVYSGATPTKPSTAQYNYNFVGWNFVDGAETKDDSATKHVKSDRVVYAAFSSRILTYVVRFMNGAQILETVSVEYNSDASYSGADPTKDATQQYTYSFIGWNTDPNASEADDTVTHAITSDRDVYAIFSGTLRSYTVTFMNEDITLGSKSVQYGSNATYSGNWPVKPSSAQYEYTFIGWNTQPGQTTEDTNALKDIKADRTVYAAFSASVRSYTVRFIDNGVVLETKSVPYGSDVTFTGDDPSRTDTAQYDYTFIGWNSSPNQTVKDDTVLQYITANRDIYAAYSMVLQTYEVEFYYNSVLLYTDTVAYGSDAVYRGSDPIKESTEEYHYEFVGWSFLENQSAEDTEALTYITGPRTLYAAFETVPNVVTVTFYNGSRLLNTITANYGSNVTYSGATPTKASTVYYTYTFAGWNSEPDQTEEEPGVLNHVTHDLTVYAAYSQTEVLYTVTFYDGMTRLGERSVTYGGSVSYPDPTRPGDEQYTYHFLGWNINKNSPTADANALTNITASKTVYAIYSQTVNEYIVRFMNGTDVLETVTVPYGSDAVYSGEDPVHPEDPDGYEFVGWNPDCTHITSNTDCQPVWVIAARNTRAIIDRTISGAYENSVATVVGQMAFESCVSLTSVNFENVTNVSYMAFRFCTNLQSVNLPKVTSISNFAFDACPNLRTVIIGTDSSSVCTLGHSNVFASATTTMRIYVPDSLVTNYKNASNWSFYRNQISGSSYIPM